MLILTRRENDTVTIGDDVVITVLSVKGRQIRLGIDAPENIKVHRGEIHERIQKGVPRLNEPVVQKKKKAKVVRRGNKLVMGTND